MTFARDLASFADSASQNLTFRNKIINGGFDIWQRGTSFTNTANAGYTADRWLTNVGTGGTIVTSQQSFTPGTAPVAGYEAPFFLRLNRSTTGSATSYFVQRIEDVRTFAGQKVTLSFWAKASSAYTFDSGDIYAWRVYGTGGSTSESPGNFGAFSLTTSWQRFSAVFNVPSVSGKTIGANSYLEISYSFPTSKGTFTIDLWGVQLEAGPAATPFETRPIQTELALCQRYYYRNTANDAYGAFGSGNATSATVTSIHIATPVTMRAYPSSMEYSSLQVGDGTNAGSVSALAFSNQGSRNIIHLAATSTGLTQYRAYYLQSANSTSGYFGLSAEL